MSVVSYCRRPACTAAPEETLLAAAQRMEKEGIGLLAVTEQGRLEGILTDRDIALHVAGGGHKATRSRIGEAMSRVPVAVGTEAPLQEALGLMRVRGVRRLPVVNEARQVVGVVSADDLVRLLSREIAGLGDVMAAQSPASGSRTTDREEGSASSTRTARHYGRDVVTSPPAASIAEIARSMQERAVGSVVVIDEDEKAIGLVTDRDIALRVVAAGRDPAKTAVSAVMSSPVIAGDARDPLEEIVERMRSGSVRRIPILRDGRPVGIVTFDDLLVAFGSELEQIGACIAGEIRSARTHSYTARIRHELEERIEEAAGQLRRLGDQTLRSLGGEIEQFVDRVVQSLGLGGAKPERSTLRVQDLMQTDVRTCTPEDSLAEPARIMWERDCGCVPVVAGDGSSRVVGMVTDRDLSMATFTKGGRLTEMQVKNAMSERIFWCHPEDSVAEAAHVMRSSQVRRLPVVDTAGRLRGILSLADVAEAAAGRRVPAGAVSDAEVAHTLEVICRPRSDIAEARR